MLRFTSCDGIDDRTHICGELPAFLSADDRRPARDQIQANYEFGGWNPMAGWELLPDHRIQYTGDPPYRPLAKAVLRNETIYLYRSDWVAIVQPGGAFEVARID